MSLAVIGGQGLRALAQPEAAGTVVRAGASAAAPPATTTTTEPPPPVTVPATSPLALPLRGCPPPPPRPGTGPPPPPSTSNLHFVAEADLPEALPAPAVSGDLRPLEGKGMWVWKYALTEGGDTDAIVREAKAAGLRQLWVRVGDSHSGFYARDFLDALVPRAHRAGLSVIGWGFPFLHDPLYDAAWSGEAVAWRGPGGARLDGFSPDIELASEGVVLTERRITVYLGLVRSAAGATTMVATVYRPTDLRWDGTYPYAAIAPYVDAFAPMVYWGCTEPGEAALQALTRLSTLRPVHLIGQGYDMATEGGRAGPPTDAETLRFLDVASRNGALGASFWVWQFIGDEQWQVLSTFPWPRVPSRS